MNKRTFPILAVLASAPPRSYRLISSALLTTLLLAAVPVTAAFAGDCDGTPSVDNVVCTRDPELPDDHVGLGLSDDTYVDDPGIISGTVAGDALDIGITSGDVFDFDAFSTGDGGDDQITVNGYVFLSVSGDWVYGNGGDDTITLNGTAFAVIGDGVFGNGGDDTIIINGTSQFANGDFALGIGEPATGGDDYIEVNGSVEGNLLGDNTDGAGGNDIIVINGTVTGQVMGDTTDFDTGAGGDDTVTLGKNASVGGTINGNSGTDTLKFRALTQAQVNALGLDPAGDTTTVNGHTYTWLNFESLLGLLAELIEQAAEEGRSLRVFFDSDSLLAIESNDGDGISVFAEHGRIAFVSFESLANIAVGESANYSTPNSAGWYVTVANLGADLDHAGHTLYQVSIYAADGSLSAQFTFTN